MFEADGVDPDDVILSPSRAAERGLTSTVTFPKGNLAPEGSLIKSTAIDPAVLDAAEPTFHKLAAIIETRLENQDWLCGDAVTIADIAVAAPMHLHEHQKLPLGCE